MNLLHVLEDTLDEVQGHTVTLPRGAVRKMVNVLRAVRDAQRAAGIVERAPARAPAATPADPTLAGVIVQALVALQTAPQPWALEQAARDFSMKTIAERAQAIVAQAGSEVTLHPRLVSRVCSEELGLTRRGKHPRTRRDMVIFEESELRALAERYGVTWPGEGASDEVQTDGG